MIATMNKYDIYSQKDRELRRMSDLERRGMPEYRKTLWETTTKDAGLTQTFGVSPFATIY
jgi:hypothetical protein